MKTFACVISLIVTLITSPLALANLGQPERVYIASKYELPEKVKLAAINTLIYQCYHHQDSHNWAGSAKLLPGNRTYKLVMAGEDRLMPHNYIFAEMVVQYDAISDKAELAKLIQCR